MADDPLPESDMVAILIEMTQGAYSLCDDAVIRADGSHVGHVKRGEIATTIPLELHDAAMVIDRFGRDIWNSGLIPPGVITYHGR